MVTTAHAADSLKEKWSAKVEGGEPVAVFFDAATASVFASVKTSSGARVDQFSAEGQLLRKNVVRASGSAGALRAYDGKIYWVAGDSLWRFAPGARRAEKVAKLPAAGVRDLAVDKDGKVYYATHASGTTVGKGADATAVLLLEKDLFILRGGELFVAEQGSQAERTHLLLCKSTAPCQGLERSSGGAWIVAEGSELKSVSAKENRVVATLPSVPGRLGYIYRKDAKEDLVVIPFPDAHTIRAYGQ